MTKDVEQFFTRDILQDIDFSAVTLWDIPGVGEPGFSTGAFYKPLPLALLTPDREELHKPV